MGTDVHSVLLNLSSELCGAQWNGKDVDKT